MSLRLFSLLYRKGQDSKLSKYFIGNRSENCDQHPLLGGWDGRGTRRNRYDPPLPNSRIRPHQSPRSLLQECFKR